MNRTSAQRADSVGTPQRWVLRHFGLIALRHQHHPLRTHSKKRSMWGSTSAERNENFIKWNRDWCFCSTRRSIQSVSAKPGLDSSCLAWHAGLLIGSSVDQPSINKEGSS